MPDATWNLKDNKVGVDRSGNFVVKGGAMIGDAAGQNISATAATLAATQAAHANRTVTLNRAAGVTVTLPAATGSGDRYRFVNGTALSAASHVVHVASSSDYMRGKAWLLAATNAAFATANTGTVATESDTATVNGTTTGGLVGDVLEFTDLATNLWQVELSLAGSGTAATPFSAAV